MFAVQAERLHVLQARVQVSYDGDDPAHQVGGQHLITSRMCGHWLSADGLPSR